jgi:hypothetical protein
MPTPETVRRSTRHETSAARRGRAGRTYGTVSTATKWNALG